MDISRLFSLPLLTKELIEQAQRKRTYVIRTIYAVILYSAALLQYFSTNRGGSSAFENLGQGKQFFMQLVWLQVWAIVLLLPALTCGALTVEKEKDTLALLLLTKLKPWTIVFEKLLSRVLNMATFQLISLPLFGIVYSIGGVELGDMVLALTTLLSLTLVVGSISILCSTWFRTTSEAFIVSYLAMLFVGCFLSLLFTGAPQPSNRPPSAFMTPAESAASYFIGQIVASILVAFPSVLISGSCLAIASSVLVERAFIPSWNLVLYVFQVADRFFNDLNQKTTGGIVLVRDRELLPLFKPIAWRETRKKSLGTFAYQFRVLMLLLAPLILVISAMMTDPRGLGFSPAFQSFPVFFWFVSVVCLTVHSTGVIPAERIRQTLDVLLVAPLTPREIVTEKLSGVRRLIKVLSVPFAVLIGFQAIWTGYINGEIRGIPASLWLELVATSLAVVVYMPLIMWIGFLFGLRTRTQIQAVLGTFGVLFLICEVPYLIADVLIPWAERSSSVGYDPEFKVVADAFQIIMRSCSPLQMMFRANELAQGFGGPVPPNKTLPANSQVEGWSLVAINFAVYGMIWLLLRRHTFRRFSKVLNRMEPSSGRKAMKEEDASNPAGTV